MNAMEKTNQEQLHGKQTRVPPVLLAERLVLLGTEMTEIAPPSSQDLRLRSSLESVDESPGPRRGH